MVTPNSMQLPAQITLPMPLSLPFRLLPGSIHSRAMAVLLNRVLADYLEQGELDMLEGRSLRVEVRDAGHHYDLTQSGGRMVASVAAPDVTLSGNIEDFLLMLARREDPDTLFFQRRLSIQGDTGLGLNIKNFLDSIDWDSLPLPGFARQGMEGALGLYQRIFG